MQTFFHQKTRDKPKQWNKHSIWSVFLSQPGTDKAVMSSPELFSQTQQKKKRLPKSSTLSNTNGTTLALGHELMSSHRRQRRDMTEGWNRSSAAAASARPHDSCAAERGRSLKAVGFFRRANHGAESSSVCAAPATSCFTRGSICSVTVLWLPRPVFGVI